MRNKNKKMLDNIITISVELTRDLIQNLETNEVQVQLNNELCSIQKSLGIPGLLEVKICDDSSTITTRSDRFLNVIINGNICCYSNKLLRMVYHYVSGDYLDGSVPCKEIKCLLEKLTKEQLNKFVIFVSIDVVKSTTEALLTKETVQNYFVNLPKTKGVEYSFETSELFEILTNILRLRISIADQATVNKVLVDAKRQGKGIPWTSEELIAALQSKIIEVHLPLKYLKELSLNVPEDEQTLFSMMRDGLFYELGLVYPKIRFIASEDINPYCFRFKINHLTTLPQIGLKPNEYLVNETPDRLKMLFNITARGYCNPTNRNICSIINSSYKAWAEECKLYTWNPIAYLILALSSELKKYGFCFINKRVLQKYLERLAFAFPALVKTIHSKVSLELIVQTLRLLVAEEVSIRNLRKILQFMIDFDFVVVDESRFIVLDDRLAAPSPPSKYWKKDPINLASFIRQSMKQEISYKFTRGGHTLEVYLIDRETERLFTNVQMTRSEEHWVKLDSYVIEQFLQAVRREVDKLSPSSYAPAILTLKDARPTIRKIIAPEFPYMPVLSYQELSPSLSIQPIARISLNS